MSEYDLAIIGGGVNGCGVAREAARRGVSVLLLEQDDLAAGTSSASTKLIHGGLRYLEHYEFRLVRESLREREVLWAMAPHAVRPLRFVLPHHAGLRPAWLLRAGLFLYDHLGGRRLLPASRSLRLRLRSDATGAPLRPEYVRAFEYSDCWVDDARLVVLLARDAAGRGATILTRNRCVAASRDGEFWRLTVEDRRRGGREEARARVLINAAGPWVAGVAADVLGVARPPIRLVKGSHIVVRRLFQHERCYLFQNADGRIVFAIPYERDFTLIGTTDEDYRGDPADAAISDGETAYLCSAVNDYLRAPVTPADVVWSYAGVRPLYDDGASAAQEVTRDYVLSLDAPSGGAALLNIYGGKITTFRRLAAAALERLGPHLPTLGPARDEAPLPGGDFPVDGFTDLLAQVRTAHPWLEAAHAERLARAYGTDAFTLLQGAAGGGDLGRRFGADLTEREVAYLMRHEWAQTAADVVWRRSKLGLRLSRAEIAGLEAWMEAVPSISG